MGVNIEKQLRSEEDDDQSRARNINAAFLILLCGPSAPGFNKARQYLEKFKDSPWREYADFYLAGIDIILTEIENIGNSDDSFQNDLYELSRFILNSKEELDADEALRNLRKVFFPEGLISHNERDEEIAHLRQKRYIALKSLNKEPIRHPERELIFTSNVLLTIPLKSQTREELRLDNRIAAHVDLMNDEEQLYWYDHPIPIGIKPEHNEVLYGLNHLSQAMHFEEKRGTKNPARNVSCILSVSVTHKGLHEISRPYLEKELKRNSNIKNLDIYVFTEEDTDRLLDMVILPAARHYLGCNERDILKKIFGVDGRYGRHYSFLKAIIAFWHVFISADIKGTFKIDLDQVFPQEQLIEESGQSVFEHLCSPLWGASGRDEKGNPVHLGLIAGALVNQKDIDKSIFTPDVPFPEGAPRGDEIIFMSSLPQALSTEAEMMAQYAENSELDGRNACLQRVHVTGGTNGILVDSLRKYRLFTPTVIGRAEDQAYLMSVLFDEKDGSYIRYCHKSGLIMRHDKEAFALEAIKSAQIGKMIGDYIRILLFSFYAEALPWSLEQIKEAVDPFTGCFISRIPWTIVYLRFAFQTAVFFEKDLKEESTRFFQEGATRINEMVEFYNHNTNSMKDTYSLEKEGWDLFYDTLDAVENDKASGDVKATEFIQLAGEIIESCKLQL